VPRLQGAHCGRLPVRPLRPQGVSGGLLVHLKALRAKTAQRLSPSVGAYEHGMAQQRKHVCTLESRQFALPVGLTIGSTDADGGV